MSDRRPAEGFPPGEYLKDELEERGWTQEEFAAIIGRPAAVVNQIISGKRGISPETASEIGAALGTTAMYWMNLESAYRLWKAGPAPARISREAGVRARFPVREMIKRGWVQASENPEVLEQRIFEFFGIASLDETPSLAHAASKTGYPEDINGPQRAWLFRVRQIAKAMVTPTYYKRALRDAMETFQTLRSEADGIRQVPNVLAKCGVRFVVVEPVPSSKIEGVCIWLKSPDWSPIIGMSLRRDRIDNFWFVLRHECEHVLNEDGREVAIVDCDIGDNTDVAVPEIAMEERIANAAAAEFCVPQAEMADFIVRHRPIFSEEKVLNFARRMQVHPGLVVGQLQRALKNYSILRKHLVSVRPFVAPVAMTQVLPSAL